MNQMWTITVKTVKGGDKVGTIKNDSGVVVHSANDSTFKNLSKKLRSSGFIPTDVAINKKGDTPFNARNR